MIPLDSPRWRELQQTYGHAAGVPDVLRRLEASGTPDDEPWPELWGMLCHDGDPGTAAYAAVPHLFAIALARPERVHAQFFALPAAIESARDEDGDGMELPDDVADAYMEAWHGVPKLIAACIEQTWDAELTIAAVAALAFAKDYRPLGELASGITPDELEALASELQGGAFEED